MRRLLLALPLCIPFYAHAQQAANPVEPFSYGVRAGTPQNPIVAALSSVVPSAHAGSTQAAAPVELFSYGRRVGTQSNPLYINLGNALDSYVTQVSLTSTLSAYLTTSDAAKTYLPLAGGTISQGLTVKGELRGYAKFIVMNGFVQQFWPSQIGVLGTNIWASSSVYGRLQIGDTGGGSGGIITGAATLTTLAGTGNAYACLDASGNLYRSSTACQ